ncbi:MULTISPECIES: DUF2622 domain-containing protein [Pseudomonas]|uniref:DUF2622 domain-containing protein n=1 Tax=Pseudomonas TaxID=286 RepID=UPI000D0018F3|nr:MULTISPECIES: DUF2622 domain-containing protein [Pseudomonas]PRA53201.1 DUF2622 domain-containing protein [Pseudomonas sp. MYb115]QXN52196.1 hypothetical protein KW062_10850 [Pseudomonas fluorescens]WSO26525.1 hypothetical protein VUJ50_10910 [Pseudomonas fluorescens]
MAQYLVRVELFGANGEGYEDLHEKMEALGLKRSVVFDDGKTYAMPIGTYFGSSSLDSGSLRDKVRIVSKPLSPTKEAAIFACQVQDQHWSAFLYQA